MASRRSRSRKKRFGSMHVAELELMPMLNVFIAIIPLLLLSAAFVQISVIQTALPGRTAVTAAPAAAEPFDLAIHIRGAGYIIVADGRVMRTIERAVGAAPVANGEVRDDLAELRAALAEIAAAHPSNREVRIVAESRTHYSDIIDVMDVSRAAGLPEAALADAATEAS